MHRGQSVGEVLGRVGRYVMQWVAGHLYVRWGWTEQRVLLRGSPMATNLQLHEVGIWV
jgi:hypothetical protein